MNDRELLELAAKACGYEHYRYCTAHMALVPEPEGEDVLPFSVWNPLTDDGDALRLAVKLRIDLQFDGDGVWAKGTKIFVQSDLCLGDPIKAAREAIVSVAAEIGRSMP